MGILDPSSPLYGASGRVGDLVLYQVNGKTYFPFPRSLHCGGMSRRRFFCRRKEADRLIFIVSLSMRREKLFRLIVIYVLIINGKFMGVFDSVLGKIRKSVGNLTMYELDGQNIVCSKKTLSRRDKKSPLQLQQRARMKKVQELGWKLLEAIVVGFPAPSYRQSRNRFVSKNIGLMILVEDGSATYDVAQLQLSAGEIVPPQVTASVDTAEGYVTFVQERQALRPLALDDDRVYGVVWGRDTDEIQVTPLNRRADPGTNRIKLDQELHGLPLELFAFAVSANGKKASATVYFWGA